MRASRGQPTAGNRPDVTRGVGDHGPVSYSRLDAGQSSDSERDNPHSATITHGSYSYKSLASDETFLTGGSSEQGDTALPSDSGLTVVALSNPHGESDAKPCDSGFHRGRLRASGRVSGFGRPRHWLGCSRSSPGYNRAGSRLAFPALRPPRAPLRSALLTGRRTLRQDRAHGARS
jgi:hypothetical protein